jgi:hypothetical protein
MWSEQPVELTYDTPDLVQLEQTHTIRSEDAA